MTRNSSVSTGTVSLLCAAASMADRSVSGSRVVRSRCRDFALRQSRFEPTMRRRCGEWKWSRTGYFQKAA